MASQARRCRVSRLESGRTSIPGTTSIRSFRHCGSANRYSASKDRSVGKVVSGVGAPNRYSPVHLVCAEAGWPRIQTSAGSGKTSENSGSATPTIGSGGPSTKGTSPTTSGADA